MTSGILRKKDIAAGKRSFSPLAHLIPHRRQGQLLLRNIRRSLGDPRTSATLHRLRDQIFFHKQEETAGGKAIGFAGPRGREGATSISLLFGLALSDLKRNRALIIDGRMERRSSAVLGEMFGLRPSALSYSSGCGRFQCFGVGRSNLSLLAPVGNADSVEVFSNAEFGRLLEDLKEAFDYVIFDLPPVLGSSEARLVLPLLDLFFLISSARRTTFSDMERSKSTISEVGGTIHGVVLNRQSFPFWASFLGRDAFV